MNFNFYDFSLEKHVTRIQEIAKDINKIPRFIWGWRREELIFHVALLTVEVEAIYDACNTAIKDTKQARKELVQIRADVKELKNQKNEAILQLAVGDLTSLSYAELVDLSESIEKFKKQKRNHNSNIDKTGHSKDTPSRDDCPDNLSFLIALAAFTDSEQSSDKVHTADRSVSSSSSNSIDNLSDSCSKSGCSECGCGGCD